MLAAALALQAEVVFENSLISSVYRHVTSLIFKIQAISIQS